MVGGKIKKQKQLAPFPIIPSCLCFPPLVTSTILSSLEVSNDDSLLLEFVVYLFDIGKETFEKKSSAKFDLS
jgi:hypothetical protein